MADQDPDAGVRRQGPMPDGMRRLLDLWSPVGGQVEEREVWIGVRGVDAGEQ